MYDKEYLLENSSVKVLSLDDMKLKILKRINQDYGTVLTNKQLGNSSQLSRHPRNNHDTWYCVEKTEHLDQLAKIQNVHIQNFSILEKKDFLVGGPGGDGKGRMKNFIIALAKSNSYLEIFQAVYNSGILIGKNGKNTIFTALTESFEIQNKINDGEDDVYQNAMELISRISSFRDYEFLYQNYLRYVVPTFMRELVHDVLERQQRDAEARKSPANSESEESEEEEVQNQLTPEQLQIFNQFPPIEDWELKTPLMILCCFKSNKGMDFKMPFYEDLFNDVVKRQKETSAYDTEKYIQARVGVELDNCSMVETVQTINNKQVKTGLLYMANIDKLKTQIFNMLNENYASIVDDQSDPLDYDQWTNPTQNFQLKDNNSFGFFSGTQKGLDRAHGFLILLRTIKSIPELVQAIETSEFSSQSKALELIYKAIAENIYLPMADDEQPYCCLQQLADRCNNRDLKAIVHDFTKEIVSLALKQLARNLKTYSGKVMEKNVEEHIASNWELPVFIARKQQHLIIEKDQLQINYEAEKRAENLKYSASLPFSL